MEQQLQARVRDPSKETRLTAGSMIPIPRNGGRTVLCVMISGPVRVGRCTRARLFMLPFSFLDCCKRPGSPQLQAGGADPYACWACWGESIPQRPAASDLHVLVLLSSLNPPRSQLLQQRSQLVVCNYTAFRAGVCRPRALSGKVMRQQGDSALLYHYCSACLAHCSHLNRQGNVDAIGTRSAECTNLFLCRSISLAVIFRSRSIGPRPRP